MLLFQFACLKAPACLRPMKPFSVSTCRSCSRLMFFLLFIPETRDLKWVFFSLASRKHTKGFMYPLVGVKRSTTREDAHCVVQRLDLHRLLCVCCAPSAFLFTCVCVCVVGSVKLAACDETPRQPRQIWTRRSVGDSRRLSTACNDEEPGARQSVRRNTNEKQNRGRRAHAVGSRRA